MARKKSHDTLTNTILKQNDTIQNLISTKNKLVGSLESRDEDTEKFMQDIADSQATLAVLNGRIGKAGYSFAVKILDKAQSDLLAFIKESNQMIRSLAEIDKILNSIELSNEKEADVLEIEKYLNNPIVSSLTSVNPDLKQLTRGSTQVRHSIDALVDLKSGVFRG